ncbi:dot2 [Candida oxycetoniae]|uniref:Dot2 n=1 Tax=Candida oxycetoniae TaxID=497107 RepID=A0AAI9SUV0_9ASCO|nr:dot2 [Candida oxycetoniae]KAI3403327.2 dot2 [Candida oxycetoniae]
MIRHVIRDLMNLGERASASINTARFSSVSVGISFEMNHDSDRDAYLRLGQRLKQQHSEQLSTQLQVFRSAMINFINEHGDEIKHNSEFRTKFNQISQSIGMDPLDLLIYSNGGFKKQTRKNDNNKSNNFTIGLSVKIVEICQETRDFNGGLIPLKELQSIITANSISSSDLKLDIDLKDIEQAIQVLNSMGSKNYEILVINGIKWLKFSSLDNLSQDQIKIYELCEFTGGYVTKRLIQDNFQWDGVRSENVINEMIMNGILWVDSQGEDGPQYWEPSWISN